MKTGALTAGKALDFNIIFWGLVFRLYATLSTVDPALKVSSAESYLKH